MRASFWFFCCCFLHTIFSLSRSCLVRFAFVEHRRFYALSPEPSICGACTACTSSCALGNGSPTNVAFLSHATICQQLMVASEYPVRCGHIPYVSATAPGSIAFPMQMDEPGPATMSTQHNAFPSSATSLSARHSSPLCASVTHFFVHSPHSVRSMLNYRKNDTQRRRL